MLQNALRLPRQLALIWRHPLNRAHRIAALRRWAFWQIASRLAPGPILVPFIGDTRLVARPGETGITANIYYGLAEYEDMAFALHLLRPHDLFVDIGANAGSYTVLASGAAGALTEAFEPIAETADRLVANVHVNALEELVIVHRSGIGSSPGTLRFTRAEDTVNHVAIGLEPGEEILVGTLDSVLREKSPTLIKVDVEGFEPEVLRGARETLRKQSLLALIVEINGSYQRYGRSLEDVIVPLTDAGFRSFSYDPRGRRIAEIPGVHSRLGNTIYVRDISAVEKRLSTAHHFSIANTFL